MLHTRHILNIGDLDKADFDYILSVANNIAEDLSRYGEVAKGKILATLFFEPSTRTRLSFESAMLRMGGQVLGFSEAGTSSAAKGESPEDTAQTVGSYCDIMVVRHPTAMVPHRMAEVAKVPVINAGDGSNEHPTQTLTDLVTVYRKFGRLQSLNIGLCGDLKHGRTVHSLIKALCRYPGNRFTLIAPDALQMPQDILDTLRRENADFTQTAGLESAIGELDILYMTRIQRERFQNPTEYRRLKGVYVLDKEKLRRAKQDMIILHPLPRVDEIPTGIDADPRAWYFKQAEYGVYARMALIIKLLGLQDLTADGLLSVHTCGPRDIAI